MTISASWLERLALILLVIIYLALTLAFSQITPFNKGQDEGYHLEYINFIKQHGRLPISYEERAQITRADFPPLYQLLVAAISINVPVEPPRFNLFWDSFRYRTIDLRQGSVWVIPTEDFQPPYQGQVLVWQMGRWFSIALGHATVLIVTRPYNKYPSPPFPPPFTPEWG